jgi:hypothetical protein
MISNECTQAVCNIILSLFIVLHTKQYALLTMYTLRYRTSENPEALRVEEFHLHDAALEHAVDLHYKGIRGRYQYWDITLDGVHVDWQEAEIILAYKADLDRRQDFIAMSNWDVDQLPF